jgi:hypothetical protein
VEGKTRRPGLGGRGSAFRRGGRRRQQQRPGRVHSHWNQYTTLLFFFLSKTIIYFFEMFVFYFFMYLKSTFLFETNENNTDTAPPSAAVLSARLSMLSVSRGSSGEGAAEGLLSPPRRSTAANVSGTMGFFLFLFFGFVHFMFLISMSKVSVIFVCGF